MNARHLRHFLVASIAANTLIAAGCIDNKKTGTGVPVDDKPPPHGSLMVQPDAVTIDVTCEPGQTFASQTAKLQAWVDKTEVTKDANTTWNLDLRELAKVEKGLVTPKCPLPHAGNVKVNAYQEGVGSAIVTLRYKAP